MRMNGENEKRVYVRSPVNSGHLIAVTAIFTSEKKCNKYLESKKGKGQGVLFVAGKYIFVADIRFVLLLDLEQRTLLPHF